MRLISMVFMIAVMAANSATAAPTSPAGTPAITSKSLKADGYKCTTVSVGFVECTKNGETTYWCSGGVGTPKPLINSGTGPQDGPVTAPQHLAPVPGGGTDPVSQHGEAVTTLPTRCP